MRLALHDYGGYPFSIELARALAQRGHAVHYSYCASLQTTPRASMQPHADDPASLTIEGLSLGEPLQKYDFVKRWRQENRFGRIVTEAVLGFEPDVVLSGNTPLDAQRTLWKACGRAGIRRAFWVQDLIGIASRRLLGRKLPGAGHLIGAYYERLERRLLRQSEAVVPITEDFRPILHDYGVPDERITVVENWTPLGAVTPQPKNNPWSAEHGLADKTVLLYSGTLGMKHNPDLLLRLALRFRDRDDVRVVVVSQGLGADWLRERKAEHGLDHLVLMGFQPFEALPDVIGTADVVLALLEPDAGVFSVPSKVLTYLCAGRPLLLAVPPANLAARIVREHRAGRVVAPSEATEFVREAEALLGDAERRHQMGRNARAYAEATFAIDQIADTIETALGTS